MIMSILLIAGAVFSFLYVVIFFASIFIEMEGHYNRPVKSPFEGTMINRNPDGTWRTERVISQGTTGSEYWDKEAIRLLTLSLESTKPTSRQKERGKRNHERDGYPIRP